MNEQSPNTKGFFDGNPKMLFVFGLVSGIALTLIVNNFSGIAIAAPNNNARDPLAVAKPDTADTGTAPSGQLAAATNEDHVRGDLKKAEVVIIEYSDFECPFCSRHHPTMLQVAEEYGDKVAWVYRHFPLSFHPQAEPAALASECAAEQDKFWEYADELFLNQALLGDSYLKSLAGDLGLNQKKFDECLDSKKYQAVVDAQTGTGAAAGVNGTPATFINGQMVSGAVPFASLKTIIDAELAK
ncbi:MAG: thioredoxin domain-containing protein [Patescibacteria group bacterium]